jgi:hypothetical protein
MDVEMVDVDEPMDGIEEERDVKRPRF